jgi:hypothetical protein
MPFLTPAALWLIVGLVFTNFVTLTLWRVEVAHHKLTQADLVVAVEKHELFVGQVEAQGKLAAAQAEAKEKQNAQIADETSRGWAAALDVVRRDVAHRVRVAANRGAGGSGLSAPSAAAPGIDAPAQVDLPPAERVIADCAEDTLTLIWLQDWITKTSHP